MTCLRIARSKSALRVLATGDSVAFARHVPGDSYRVIIERQESASDVVLVRFGRVA
jgi:hypothetical protein